MKTFLTVLVIILALTQPARAQTVAQGAPGDPADAWPVKAVDFTASGTITSSTCPGSGCVEVSTVGKSSVGILLVGTFDANIVFEQSIDGTTWTGAYATDWVGGIAGGQAELEGQFNVPVAGAVKLRVHCTFFTSGSVDVTLVAREGGVPLTVIANSNNIPVSARIDSWFNSGAPTVGQKTMVNSIPVVVASNQTAFPVSVSGSVSSNIATWIGSAAPTIGQKTMALSVPVVISSNQTIIPVQGSGGTFDAIDTIVNPIAVDSANIDRWADFTLADPLDLDQGAGDSRFIGVNLRTFFNGGSVEAGQFATPFGSMVVKWGDDGAGGSFALAPPIDLNATGTQYYPGVSLRRSADGGSVEAGTLTNAFGVQIVQTGTSNDVDLAAWLGSTAPTVGQKTMASSVPVVLPSDQTAIPTQVNAGLTAIVTGQQAVTASAVALPSNAGRLVCLKVVASGTQNVFYGAAGVTTGTGQQLVPGEGICRPLDNSSRLFVIAAGTGSTVAFEVY